ncbi:hypothetical protein AVEN_184523-1, partial [Araneus ventricosus]
MKLASGFEATRRLSGDGPRNFELMSNDLRRHPPTQASERKFEPGEFNPKIGERTVQQRIPRLALLDDFTPE